ncbi:hypothetical protein I302_106365 [Kwoniella bestiolae CBS 10118]|uniref:Uncharacterized protein n=1 Tax=Kwoniella bestiolae CBS 10118 TaxID=1296100 RepID=A0A1B9G3Q9_9TREE|nr:hypothetical protein I302_05488 [Kwoniella bestiolae CBS 10118]OCF25664.1 hypothetical protein I302_05488 [Kwoniella bestiolae CBS 10118]
MSTPEKTEANPTTRTESEGTRTSTSSSASRRKSVTFAPNISTFIPDNTVRPDELQEDAPVGDVGGNASDRAQFSSMSHSIGPVPSSDIRGDKSGVGISDDTNGSQ